MVTELAAWKARASNEQRVTGDNTQDSNADLNAACQAAQLALDENAKFSKLNSAEKIRAVKEIEERQAEATRAREAAAMGLDKATMEARAGQGQRASPTPKAEEVFVYGAGADDGVSSSSSSSFSAISQLVDVLKKESENTAKVARMAAETDQLREGRLKTEGEKKADLDKATLEAATEQRKRDLDIAEKRQAAEAEASSAESKRRKAETDASASAASISVKADAEAAVTRAEAEQAAVRAQVALAQVRAQEAQTAMMMRMIEMISKKE